MAVDMARVTQVFASGQAGTRVGSGYVVGDRLVLTAAHVCTEAGLAVGGRAEVCLLGSGWVTAAVIWLSADADVALIQVDDSEAWPDADTSVLRWGDLVGADPVAAAAIGFPWSQERPDRVRDTEHAVGFVAPGAGKQSKALHLTVLSSAPATRHAGTMPGSEGARGVSAWAGMSGAALLVGPFLVGVVATDPAKYGNDRLVAVPTARILAAAGFVDALGERPAVAAVGAGWRLQFAADRSLTLSWPYRPLPPGFNTAAARHRLCNPEHAVVPFAGREDLVADLTGWCSRGEAKLSVRTVTGGGGSGKTRLAAQVCVAVAGLGFDTGFADVDRSGGTTRWMLERPTLLVVDNADLNIGLVGELINSLAYTDVPVRLLLVARARDPWWSTLQTTTESLVDGLDDGDVSLTTNLLSPAVRHGHYRAACTAFAAALNGADQIVPEPESPDMTAGAFGDPLMVHLAALLAVSGDPLGPMPESDMQIRSTVLRAMLDLEASRWPKQIATEGIGAGPVVLRRCVATATVSAPNEEPSAAAMLTAVPDLSADSETGRRYGLARWLHTLNLGLDYWNPLRPDPLADQLLADLDILPTLTAAVADTAIEHGDLPTLERLLAELTRAAVANKGMATQALTRLLYERLSDLLDIVLADPQGSLPQRLAAALQQAAVTEIVVTQVNRLPTQSVSLADLASVLAAQAVDHYRAAAATDPDTYTPDLAGSLNNQSVRLLGLGRREDALAAVEEAVGYYRGLSAIRPDAFVPDLAGSLNNQASMLSGLGRREDALAAVEEAVGYYRGLAVARPDAFVPHLAGSLNNQSSMLSGLGRRE
ncbi:S1 family peptidase, partial [Nocardia tengchongensis]|uniref:S1 family peptidase n=1 Tax=Nocardia tengchongensis TaxID=2055889 RepID=UPI0036A09E1A